jgi:hypothetical protein
MVVVLLLRQLMETTTIKKLLKCPRCKNEWVTKSDRIKVNCTSCTKPILNTYSTKYAQYLEFKRKKEAKRRVK